MMLLLKENSGKNRLPLKERNSPDGEFFCPSDPFKNNLLHRPRRQISTQIPHLHGVGEPIAELDRRLLFLQNLQQG